MRGLPEGWEERGGALEREFRFGDFVEALAFVNRVGEAAEAADHHPDVAIHWNRVTLRWWTHTKNAITERDIAMAERANEVAASFRRDRAGT
jgi:4a-hydroxytetrahydrobiopterin dehydratase